MNLKGGNSTALAVERVRHFWYTTNMKNKAIVGQSVPLINSYAIKKGSQTWVKLEK